MGKPYTWVAKIVKENEVFMSSWTKEKAVGVWDWAHQGMGNQFRGLWKSKCLVNKIPLGPPRTNEAQREILTDSVTFLPITPSLHYNIALWWWFFWRSSSLQLLVLLLGVEGDAQRIFLSLLGLDSFSAQNNLHVTMAHHGVACPWSLH